jgi:hypothetical protein
MSTRIAPRFETGKHDGTDTGKSGAGRSGDGAEDGAGDGAHDAEPAPEMAHEHVHQIDELLSDASPLHDAPCHDEESDGDERNGVHLGEGVGQELAWSVTAAAGPAEEDQPSRRGHEADRNGNTEHQ